MALIFFRSTECVTFIYVLGFNYHIALTFFTLMHGFSGIEMYFVSGFFGEMVSCGSIKTNYIFIKKIY